MWWIGLISIIALMWIFDSVAKVVAVLIGVGAATQILGQWALRR